jgi:Concanavalin A-like lectin/glucanases superfamily
VRARLSFAIAVAGAGLFGCLGCSPGPLEVATLSSGTLANGLVAHWALDEGTGTLANDDSGNGHNGFVVGPSWIAGQFGGALHFSDASYMSAGGFPFATPSYSVSAWALIQPYELTAPIANMISTEAPGGGWALYATLGQGGGSYVFRFFAPSAMQSYEIASCTCVVTGSWVHLAVVVDGDASTLTLYVNGAPTKITTTSGILPGSPTLYLARTAELTPPFPLTGALDDIAIYSRALVAQEVAQLGQGPALPPQSP